MDPVSVASLRALAQVLQLRPGASAPELEALLKSVGQELALRFLGQVAEGAQLEFPDGRVMTAQGEVPYPPGTELRVKVALEGSEKGGALKLLTLEAKPPPMPALLAPLARSEAAPLLNQLQRSIPLPELEPLVRLMRLLADPPETPLPSPERVVKALETLPPETARALAKALGAAPETPLPVVAQRLLSAAEPPALRPQVSAPKDAAPAPPSSAPKVAVPESSPASPKATVRPEERLLAQIAPRLMFPGLPVEARPELEGFVRQVLARLFQETDVAPEAPVAQGQVPQALAGELEAVPREVLRALETALDLEPEAPLPSLAQRLLGLKEALKAELPATSAPELLNRLQRLLARADLPRETRQVLDTWLRGLLGRTVPEARSAPQLAAEAGSRLLPRAELAKVASALARVEVPSREVPESWEAWVKGTLRALTDPEVSPREAPFHATQAREATGYFELPLPWGCGKPLQLWVEEDAPESRPEGGEKITRLLISLHLSRLGEARIGLQRAGEALAARIWCEHPERLEAQIESIERELREIAATVDLRLLPLHPGSQGGIPDLRTLVRGSSLHALG